MWILNENIIIILVYLDHLINQSSMKSNIWNYFTINTADQTKANCAVCKFRIKLSCFNYAFKWRRTDLAALYFDWQLTQIS